jgi:hypothetical protein
VDKAVRHHETNNPLLANWPKKGDAYNTTQEKQSISTNTIYSVIA